MALPATATFTAADGTLLTAIGSDWAAVQYNFAVQSNAVGPNFTAGDGAVRWASDNFSNDQYSKATVVAISNGNYVGVAVRCSNSAQSWYEVLGDSADGTYFYKVVNGVGTALAATSAPLVLNDQLEIRAVGTTISWYKNGVLQQSVTDSSLTSGYAGVAGAGAPSSRVDNWEGGNFSTGITGSASITLGALTASGAGSLAISGAAAITLGDVTLSATGSLGSSPIAGEAAITLGALILVATGVLAIEGEASITLSALTVSATGTLAIEGEASITLGALTVNAQGHFLTGVCVTGVLQVSANGRYFANNNGPIVLSGMHTWYNVQDGGDDDPPPVFDWDEYLEALVDYGHNCTKLWRLETARDWGGFPGQVFGQNAYARTGPGNAADGHPKFDLDTWNDEYFARLRTRAIEAGNAGIYVIAQLFQGWHLDNKSQGSGDPWPYHPFENGNNINNVDGDVNNDGDGFELRNVSQTALYTRSLAFVDKMIATLGDLDHIIWEVCNEDTQSSAAVTWQRAIAAYIKAEDTRNHPVGITKLYPGGDNGDLFASSDADWISIDDNSDPDEADGSKVILWDTDHVFGVTSTYQWVLRSFAQGHNPLYMDVWDGALYGSDTRANADYILIRRLMGDAVGYSERMDLLNAEPDGSLSETGWCLASPTELFVYQDDTGAFDVNLSGYGGVFTLEWYRVSNGTTQAGSNVTGGASRTLTPPWSGEVVAFLSQGNSGEAAITLGAVTVVAAGTLKINGVASITLAAITTTATGVVAIEGEASITLGAITISAVGVLAIEGDTALALGAITVAAVGTLAIGGEASITLDSITVAAEGDLVEVGTGQANLALGAMTAVATGQLSIQGQASITVGLIILVATGALTNRGAANLTLGAIAITATGGETEIEIPTIAAIVYGPSATGTVSGQ